MLTVEEGEDRLNTLLSSRILKEFTIIIPTVGRPILKECLESIMKGRALPARIVVIDQGNNLDVAEWLQDVDDFGVEVLHIRSVGRSPASARNDGMAHVQTMFVAAIDDDCLAEPEWLETIQRHFHNNPKVIITGRVEAAGPGIPLSVVTTTTPQLTRRLSIRKLTVLASGNMAVSLEMAKIIGPFDENLFTAEDQDWAYRAMRVGIPVFYTPDVVVHHYHWRDHSQTAANYQDYAAGLGAFYGKHLRQGDLTMILRTLLVLFRGAKSFLKGWIIKDQSLSQDGYARLTELVPGLIKGWMGLRVRSKG